MKDRGKLLLILSLLWALVILMLGLWWLYLLVQLSQNGSEGMQPGRDVMSMVKWEGGSFLILLLSLSGTLFVLYFKDQRKTKALQAFFASLTHELKTPLASMRLQAEVLRDVLEQKPDAQNKVASSDSSESQLALDVSDRLIEDSIKLEHQMDKILQLSRIERGGRLSSSSVDLAQFIRESFSNWNKDLKLELKSAANLPKVQVDEFALKLILRNLMENTKQHTESSVVLIELKNLAPEQVQLIYCDQGHFSGDERKLGSLFYKFKSPKGSGIGLYLCKKLMSAMGGVMQLMAKQENFKVLLTFKTRRL